MRADAGSPDNVRPISGRARVVSILCAILVAVALPYANLVIRGSRPANTSLPFGVVALGFAVVALNALAARVCRRLSLSRDDILIVLVALMVSSAVPTWGLIGQLLPIMAGAQYYATPENRWEELLLENVPPWMAPSLPHVNRQFFEGLSPGAAIPWGAWAGPLAAWGVFAAALYATMAGIMLLLRPQWVDRERLIFPLMRLPVELAQVDGPRRIPPILSDPLLWVGVFIALVPTVLNGLHFYIPSIPAMRLRNTLYIPMQQETLILHLWLNFAVIGFTYVVSADLGFTLWFFALIAALQTPLMRLAGVSLGGKEVYCAGSPAVSNQAMGAMIFLVGAGVWAAREVLAKAWRATWRSGPPVEALCEPAHPRVGILLTGGGFLVMAGWLIAGGLKPLPAVIFLVGAFVNFIALTRATVQGGIPVTRAALIPQSFAAYAVGSPAIGAKGLTSLGYAFAWSADIRVVMMTFVSHSFKLWSETHPRRRGLLPLMAASAVIAAIGGIVITLYFAYTKGGVSLSSWLFRGNPVSAFTYVTGQMQTPAEPGFGRFAYLAIGAGVMGLLTSLHYRFLWWPLHPLGFAVAATQPVQDLWLPIIIGWALKSFTMRYGGYRLYRRSLPLLLGAILGQSLGCAAWLLVDGLLGKTGNLIFVY